jgi:protocatechuate 3,4-dioxygenase, beta subunit
MKNRSDLIASRRNFFKLSLGAVGTLTAAQSLAQMCGVKTGEQVLGPFFPVPGSPETLIKENPDPAVPIYLSNDNDLTFVQGHSGTAQGQVVYIKGQVTDELCNPIPHATIVIWQASETGRYNHKGDAANPDFIHPKTGQTIKRRHDPNFQYWGRTVTDGNGDYQFKTIIPGFYPADLASAWYRPPHIHFMVSATGFPQFVTQLYFRGEKVLANDFIQELNQQDAILQSSNITDTQRQNLIVEFKDDSTGSITDGLLGQFNLTLSR